MGTVNILRYQKRRLVLVLVAAFWVALLSCQDQGRDPAPNSHLLVGARWLESRLQREGVRVVDLRPLEEYNLAHVPGAVQLDLSLVRATISGIRGQVAPPEVVEGLLSERGIDAKTTTVIYDASTGIDASRLLWTMQYYGHLDVRVLNGGWGAWQRAGMTASTETPPVTPKRFVAKPRAELIADAAWVLNHLEDDGITFVDARSFEEYTGEDARSKRGGHIPGAISVDWRTTLNPDGSIQDIDSLRAIYRAAGLELGQEVVSYCHTGHRAAHDYLTLRALGYEVRVHDGSWEEWGNRDDTPVEQ